MTQYLYNLQRVTYTLGLIKQYDGQTISAIASQVGSTWIYGHVDEMIDNGLAVKRGTFYGGRQVVRMTRKGQEVLDILNSLKDRINDPDGEDEVLKEGYHREEMDRW